jgi:hypothetical protein
LQLGINFVLSVDCSFSFFLLLLLPVKVLLISFAYLHLFLLGLFGISFSLLDGHQRVLSVLLLLDFVVNNCLLALSFCLCKTFFLLLDQILLKLPDSSFLSLILQFSLNFLVLLHIVFEFCLSQFVFKDLSLLVFFLLLKIKLVFLLSLLIPIFLSFTKGLVHFILVLDNCSPFVIYHLFSSDRQMSLVWRSFSAWSSAITFGLSHFLHGLHIKILAQASQEGLVAIFVEVSKISGVYFVEVIVNHVSCILTVHL